ncbi:hypothetical protein TNCV_500471 [Trichonephila clavipes]|nr:hypothetical protein TNCV_500471 [Trichonephila clavipes]
MNEKIAECCERHVIGIFRESAQHPPCPKDSNKPVDKKNGAFHSEQTILPSLNANGHPGTDRNKRSEPNCGPRVATENGTAYSINYEMGEEEFILRVAANFRIQVL